MNWRSPSRIGKICRAMPRQDLRTEYAMQAAGLADRFTEVFGRKRIGGGFHTDMTAPDGPSTGGGVQMLQHVRLLWPKRGPAVVMGSLDQIKMRATIRSYGYIASLAEERGLDLSLTEADYEQLSGLVKKFFEEREVAVWFEDTPPKARADEPTGVAAPSSGGAGFLIGFLVGGLVVGSLVFAATWLFLTRH
jgi:hypothetical protein